MELITRFIMASLGIIGALFLIFGLPNHSESQLEIYKLVLFFLIVNFVTFLIFYKAALFISRLVNNIDYSDDAHD